MASLKELLAQREALEREIESRKKQEHADAVERIHSLMADHGLTLADLGRRKAKAKSGVRARKVAPKYRNASTGETWSGRGLQPRWLKAALAGGRKLQEFAL
jgi:DNA-binding protein H-NS